MTTRDLRREFVNFRTRPDRPTYIGRRFRPYLTGRVLDVGCDQAILKSMLGADRYLGVGLTDEAGLQLDLETAGRLPFEDATWDTVICLDTLEHLNNLHAFCDELFRVAGSHVILSLPNCWSHARRYLAKGKGTICHYGLPLTPPVDRHKWFFNTEEACAFLRARAGGRAAAAVLEMVALEHRRPLINRVWRRIKYPARARFLNLYVETVVCVYGLGASARR